jgi:hypothetical protein
MTEQLNQAIEAAVASGKPTVKIGDKTYEFDAEALGEYKDEAFKYLEAEARAKEDFKGSIDSAAEATGLPKKFISKYLKKKFKDETKAAKQEGDAFAAVDEALEA